MNRMLFFAACLISFGTLAAPPEIALPYSVVRRTLLHGIPLRDVERAVEVPGRGFLVTGTPGDKRPVGFYSYDGQRIGTVGGVGQALGEYTFVSGVAVDPQNRIWILDPSVRRIQVFSLQGPLADTFILKNPTFSPDSVVISAGSDRVFLAGCQSTGATPDDGSLFVHEYELSSKRHIRSFVSSETEPNWVPRHYRRLSLMSMDRLDQHHLVLSNAAVQGIWFVDLRDLKSRIARLAAVPEVPVILNEHQGAEYIKSALTVRKVLVAGNRIFVVARKGMEQQAGLTLVLSTSGQELGRWSKAPGVPVGRTASGHLVLASSVGDGTELLEVQFVR